MKNLILLTCLIFLVGCSSYPNEYDYDRSTNFSTIKTYNYYGDNVWSGFNKLDSAAIMQAIDKTLFSKGMIKNTESPDVYIALSIYQNDGVKTNTVNLGIGGGSGGRGFGIGLGTSVGIPIRSKVKNYSIKIDIDEAQSKNLIWTGKLENRESFSSDPKEKNTMYQNMVKKLLKNYPPKIKK